MRVKNEAKTKRYLTPNEVAERLMVSPITVRQWAQKGELHALATPGGHRRFLHHEIERFAREKGLTLQPAASDVLRILIVDDDEHLVSYLQELFKSLPDAIKTEATYDGFDAGRKVQLFQPHIIILDLMMPNLNGFDVCRLLKEDPSTRAIRIIAITGYYTEENVKLIRKAGADACLTKPIDTEQLLATIGLGNVLAVAHEV